MLFLLSIIFRCREKKRKMDPNQAPQYNPQEFPNIQPMQWQQQNQQPLAPQPQHPQGHPPHASATTPQLNSMYPLSQPMGQMPQPIAQSQGQQGPAQFPFPQPDTGRMAQGPQHIVQQPQMAPPGLVQQPQQTQRGTPLGAGGAPGQFINPWQPKRPPTPMPSAHQSVHAGSSNVSPLQQAPLGPSMMPNHPSGLNQHPIQQGGPQIVPQNVQQRPPTAISNAHQSVHGRSFSVPPLQQAAHGQPMAPGHPSGLSQHPVQQGGPQIVPQNVQQPLQGGFFNVPPVQQATLIPPVDPSHAAGLRLHPSQQGTPQQVPHIAQNPVHLASPVAPASSAGPSHTGSARE